MSQRPRRRFVQFDPDEQRRENDRILGAPEAAQEPAARILLGPAEARASVPVRPPSKYSWNSFSLFSGLAAAALPLLSPAAWKICTVVAVRQLHLAEAQTRNASTPVAISFDDFCVATHLSRMTVIKAIREIIQADWLAQEKRRTPHGGQAVSLYSINWKKAERAERERRKKP
jgi:hypothetical protein